MILVTAKVIGTRCTANNDRFVNVEWLRDVSNPKGNYTIQSTCEFMDNQHEFDLNDKVEIRVVKA
jgi:hypothetical protein